MLIIKEKLKENIEELSEEEASEILDFVEFIKNKKDKNKKYKREVSFGSGYLGKVKDELNREDLYCDR